MSWLFQTGKGFLQISCLFSFVRAVFIGQVNCFM